jgi:hypothetical protein
MITERTCKEDICGWPGEDYTIPQDKILPINFIPYFISGKIILHLLTMLTNEENGRRKHKGATTFSIQDASRWDSQFVQIEYKEAWVKLSSSKGNYIPIAPLYLFPRHLTLELAGHLIQSPWAPLEPIGWSCCPAEPRWVCRPTRSADPEGLTPPLPFRVRTPSSPRNPLLAAWRISSHAETPSPLLNPPLMHHYHPLWMARALSPSLRRPPRRGRCSSHCRISKGGSTHGGRLHLWCATACLSPPCGE